MSDAAYFGIEVGTLMDSTVLELGAGRYRVNSASIAATLARGLGRNAG
ncbi:hypothetical protein [Streptomyces atratus]|nr:hypothetical protein [Streptomyces atratus]